MTCIHAELAAVSAIHGGLCHQQQHQEAALRNGRQRAGARQQGKPQTLHDLQYGHQAAESLQQAAGMVCEVSAGMASAHHWSAVSSQWGIIATHIPVQHWLHCITHMRPAPVQLDLWLSRLSKCALQ